MQPIIRYILLTASRDWLFLGLMILIVIAAGISMFLGSTALSEQSLMQVAYISGSARLILIIGMILFICFHIRRSFDNREIEFNLSRPISRSKFVLAYFFAFACLAAIILVPLLFILVVFFKLSFVISLLWCLSLFYEILIISSFAILSSLMLKSAVTSVLLSFCTYFLSRIIGFAVSTIIIPKQVQNFNLNTLMELFLKFVSIFLPRLDLFTKSKWLVYQSVEIAIFQIITFQTFIYVALILVATLLDFKKREF
ncbi:MAG: hypothetical protein ISQ32_00745 [Rickettsiales bacterium]|nr:hypothetical protein [Rickettsiales bacterium]